MKWNQALFVLLVLLASSRAHGWDAGPPECKHSECSGGALPAGSGVPDTQPRYANSVLPDLGRLADCPAGYTNDLTYCGRGDDSIPAGSLVANCPSGYTNWGLFCLQGVTSYSKGCTTIFHDYPCAAGYTDWGCFCVRGGSTLGTSSMSCPSGYFLNTNLGRCYKICPSGYTNYGETCYRPPSTLGMGSMTCGPGEHRSGAYCYKDSACTSDREYWGGLCYKKCPQGTKRTAVSTCLHQNRWRGNTHLLIVNRAISLLSTSPDPVARRAVQAMQDPTCRSAWEDGLWDADDGDLADYPNALGSHFYAGAGKDWKGQPTWVTTYLIAGVEQNAHGNARSNAKARIDQFYQDFSQDPARCENLGLALHYLTDMTQPMHTTTFSGGSIPLGLHPVLEDYVPWLHNRFPRPETWDQRDIQRSADGVFLATSQRSAGAAPALMSALSYDGTLCTMTSEAGHTYTGYCFLDVPRVDDLLSKIVTDGYQATASYIYTVFKGAPSAP